MNTTKTIRILFYKGPGTFAEKLIRLWTLSPYAHSEFGRSDGLYHSNDRFHLHSRLKELDIHPKEWESCELILPDIIVERIEKRQLKKNGTSYDWMGIVFSHVFKLKLHDQRRWFCSKSNADDLLYAYHLMKRSKISCFEPFIKAFDPITRTSPHELSPGGLFTIVKQIEQHQKVTKST